MQAFNAGSLDLRNLNPDAIAGQNQTTRDLICAEAQMKLIYHGVWWNGIHDHSGVNGAMMALWCN